MSKKSIFNYFDDNRIGEFLEENPELGVLKNFQFDEVAVVEYLCKKYQCGEFYTNANYTVSLFMDPISTLMSNNDDKIDYVTLLCYYDKIMSTESAPLYVREICFDIKTELAVNYHAYSKIKQCDSCQEIVATTNFPDFLMSNISDNPPLMSTIEYSHGLFLNRASILTFLIRRYNFYANVMHGAFDMKDQTSAIAIKCIFISPITIIFGLPDDASDIYGKMLVYYYGLYNHYKNAGMQRIMDVVWEIYFEFLSNRDTFLKSSPRTITTDSSYMKTIEWLRSVYNTIVPQ